MLRDRYDSKAAPHRRGPGHGLEWRVQWRRAAWSDTAATKSRSFARRADLDRFIARLARSRHSPLTHVGVSWRKVGPWQPEGER